MSYRKNDVLTVEIEDIGHDGAGIGKVDGYPLFIKDAVIGDVVEVKVMKAKKNYGYAKLLKIITPSASRVEPLCPYAKQCGGCQIQMMSYEEQLRFKENKVRNNLKRIGGFEEIPMEPILGMKNPFYYRNKAQFPVGYDKEGNLITGFYAGTHSIINNRRCYLGVSENELVLNQVLDWMERNHISAYEEESGKGLIRHVLIRYGFTTKEVMVCLVVNGAGIPAKEDLIEGLRTIPGMTSITISSNTKQTNVIMGEKITLLWGQPYITDFIGNIQYQISPLSFYQVNPAQTKRLYETALEYAGLSGDETVWDLYCGIGTISLFLAQRAKQVYGVEIIPAAIEDAKRNARLNQIENAQFFVGKAEEVLPEKYEKEQIYADVIVVDPPRKGCEESVLDTMVQMEPKRIVYVSCDSATLARDLKYLCERGYEMKKVKAIDQFPQTEHVETVVLLSKGEVDSKKVRVEFSLEDMDMSDFQDSATYAQIKDYVLEHSGLKVSNLYISQIKRKCGIEVGKNYNLPKSEDSRQPQCPPEKEKAIREAFEYFGLI